MFAVEILRVYFIMPFPGSQKADTIGIAYFIARNIFWLRVLALLLLAYPFWQTIRQDKLWKKLVVITVAAFYCFVFFKFNYRFEADKMFYQPEHKSFAAGAANTIRQDKLVIGVEINGQAKAYPIQIIGYHHQVRDTLGNTPVMITYCTVCRTGRVYSPFVNGKAETFRLVGMDHFNAMFEDATTKSWWQQATGEAIAGSLKGTALKEIPSQQLTLSAWLQQHPSSTVLQPDTIFNKDYKDLADFDKGTVKSSLEKRDSGSWKNKSWVVGVATAKASKAYDWNDLVKQGIINDSIGGQAIVLVLEKDSTSFHVWKRMMVGKKAITFTRNVETNTLTDAGTRSVWNMNGVCVEGSLTGLQLETTQSYQEFWHSWKYFHSGTLIYKKD